MERRNFLKTLAGGAIGWAAVDPLFGSLATPAFAGQVPFVRDPSAAGFDVHPEELFAVDDGQTARLQTTTYPQSVASGDPKPHGVVLWTRIDPTTVVGLLAGVALVLSSRKIPSRPAASS